MNIKKKHKLYFIHKDGSARRLDNVVPELHAYILDQFMNHGYTMQFEKMNKDRKQGHAYKPVMLPVYPNNAQYFIKLRKYLDNSEKITMIQILYTHMDMPLCNLILKK